MSKMMICGFASLLLLSYSTFAFVPQLSPARVGTFLQAGSLNPPESKVLVVGLGALPLLTMKTAFFAGYKEILYILPEVQVRLCVCICLFVCFTMLCVTTSEATS